MKDTYGWVGKILRVDLTAGKTTDVDTMKYAKDFLGGRGINAKIAWDEIPPEAGPFDPENRLLIMTGPLTGTATPGTGKLEINGFGPQVYPKEYYTHGSMGGGFGAELKYAGYDGVIVQGKSEEPVYVWVHDGEAEIRSAKRLERTLSPLWGTDIFSAQQLLIKEHGAGTSVITIGQAGENLVRYAIIANETENAAAQGGFGALMGSKKLKAIAAKGKGSIKVADKEKFLETRKRFENMLRARGPSGQTMGTLVPLRDPKSKKEVLTRWSAHLGVVGLMDYEWKYTSCPGCEGLCQMKMILNVPGRLSPTLNTADIHCLERRWVVPGWNIPPRASGPGAGPYGLYKQDHKTLPKKVPMIKDLESSFEAKVFADKLGINMSEFTLNLMTWLTLCEEHEIITDKDIGIPYPRDRGEFWSLLLHKIANREGIGDAFAEGVPRAADVLKKGKEYVPNPAHGSSEQGLSRGIQAGGGRFPSWVIAGLVWVTGTRDEMPSTRMGDRPAGLSDEQLRAYAKERYGSEKAFDATYDGKGARVAEGQNISMVRESIITCGQAMREEPEIMSTMLSAVTGMEWAVEDWAKIGERIFNLERAIMVRQGRRRDYDVGCGIIEYLTEKPDTDGVRLDKEKFLQQLDEYYTRRKWNVKTGIPTREKLRELNLSYVADDFKKRGIPL